MIKVLALGGAGAQGMFATRELLNYDDVSEVIVGDYDIEKARKAVESLGSEKVEAVKIDVRDRDELISLMKNVDIVVNTVGPFYMYGPLILDACIKAGRDYVDICDDTDATLKMLAMDEEARKSGVTAVIGMGASPGLSNIFSAYLANKLDSVSEIRQYWVVDNSDPEGLAVMYHAAHGITGKVYQYLNGQLVKVPAGSGSEVVEFLSGKAEVVYYGHPEPVTLPKYIKSVKTVINKGGFLPSSDFKMFKLMAKMGLFSTRSIGGISPRRISVSILHKLTSRQKPEEKTRTAMKIEVSGEKDGEYVKYAIDGWGVMGPATGIPAAVTAILIGRGEVKMKGVYPPEGCINAESFMKLVREKIPPGYVLTLEEVHRGPLFKETS